MGCWGRDAVDPAGRRLGLRWKEGGRRSDRRLPHEKSGVRSIEGCGAKWERLLPCAVAAAAGAAGGDGSALGRGALALGNRVEGWAAGV